MIARDIARLVDDPPPTSFRVAEVVDGVEEDLDVFVASVEDRVVARIQATRGRLSMPMQESLRRSVLATVRDALARLRSRAELPRELPPDLVEFARLWVSAQFELSELADAWLVGQEVFWDRFQLMAERALEDTALCWDVIKAARVQLRGHAAQVSELFRRACESESARAAGIYEDSRWRAVSRALEGHWVDAHELGYDLGDCHTAVVADVASSLDGLASRTKRHVLLLPAPDGGTWGWLGGRTAVSDSELDALIEWQGDRDGHVAFGEPAAGLAGFATSHQQALEARTIAAATDQRAVRFADLRLLIAVLRDGELATAFVERELGDLDQPSERMRELRATLRAYLEHSQSVAATAALRRRDRKTIQRQLRSAERLLHHRVSDRNDELLVALRIADILRHRDHPSDPLTPLRVPPQPQVFPVARA